MLCAQGKQEPWEKAQDLTRQAMESARTAQIKSCDAQKTYENYTRATEAAKAATDRQAQVCLSHNCVVFGYLMCQEQVCCVLVRHQHFACNYA